jgi:hypothetical protein
MLRVDTATPSEGGGEAEAEEEGQGDAEEGKETGGDQEGEHQHHAHVREDEEEEEGRGRHSPAAVGETGRGSSKVELREQIRTLSPADVNAIAEAVMQKMQARWE